MKWLQRGALAAGLLGAASAALVTPLQAQELAVLKRATALRDSPSDGGNAVVSLEAQTAVARSTERKGPWVKVSTAQGATGWVHMFDLSATAGAGAAPGTAPSAASGLRTLGALLGGSPGPSTTATSTVGLRGLGAEDLAKAQPNRTAVTQAEELRASADQARRFGQQAALQVREVPPLAPPPLPLSGSTGGSGSAPSNPSDPNFSPN